MGETIGTGERPSLEDFAEYIARELDLQPDELANWVDEELELDSLQRFELELVVEDLGVRIPEGSLVTCQTLREVHMATFGQ